MIRRGSNRHNALLIKSSDALTYSSQTARLSPAPNRTCVFASSNAATKKTPTQKSSPTTKWCFSTRAAGKSIPASCAAYGPWWRSTARSAKWNSSPTTWSGARKAWPTFTAAVERSKPSSSRSNKPSSSPTSWVTTPTPCDGKSGARSCAMCCYATKPS